MKNLNKLLLISLLTLCLCFVGCGGNNDNKDSDKGTTAESSDVIVSDTDVSDVSGKSDTGGNDVAEGSASSDNAQRDEDVTDDSSPVIPGTAPVNGNDNDSPVTETKSAADSGSNRQTAAADTSKKADKTVTEKEEPLIQTLEDGGIQLPEDVWE